MEHSIVMLHDISQAMTEDYHRVLENELISLRLSKDILNTILHKQNVKKPLDLLKPEATYMLGKQAVERGLADYVIKDFNELYNITVI